MFNEWMDEWDIAIFKGRRKEFEELVEKVSNKGLIKTPATFLQRFLFYFQTFYSQHFRPFQIRAVTQASIRT